MNLINFFFSFSLPVWTKSIYPSNDLDKLTYFFLALRAYTVEQAKFRSGYLLKDILDRSVAKSTGQLNPNRTVWMYSSHDTVLFAILYSLGIRNVNL